MALTAYTLAGLTTALQDYGHQYLSTARGNEMIDQAAQRCLLEELWPFRVADATVPAAGGAPTSGVLGPIKQVSSVFGGASIVLAPALEDQLSDMRSGSGIALGAAGQARNYYVRWVGGARQRVFDPALTATAAVKHWSPQVWVDVVDGVSVLTTSVPVWPRTHREVLLAAARVLAYEDIDDYEAAAQQELKYQRKLDEARDQLLSEQWDEPDYMTVRGEMV
jgi:hypothetical protein